MLKEILQRGQRLADAALERLLPPGTQYPPSIHQAMRHSVFAGGKRLRPILCMEAGRMIHAGAGQATADGLPPGIADLGAALEMLHTYSLIHDDLPALDNDDLRRGRPTCHVAFGEATAILAGDALLTLAFEVLAGEVQPPAVAAGCCAALAKAAGACNMVGGQVDDMSAEGGESGAQQAANGFPPSLANLESIHRRKTGAMIQISLRLGAMVAGATAQQRAALDAYGQRLGLAFQITDDLLDVRSNQAAMGKRVGKDAKRGKLTFPGLLGLDPSAQRAQESIVEACQALAAFGSQADGLRTLARYIVDRDH